MRFGKKYLSDSKENPIPYGKQETPKEIELTSIFSLASNLGRYTTCRRTNGYFESTTQFFQNNARYWRQNKLATIFSVSKDAEKVGDGDKERRTG